MTQQLFMSQPFPPASCRHTHPCRQLGQWGWCGGCGHPPPQLPEGLQEGELVQEQVQALSGLWAVEMHRSLKPPKCSTHLSHEHQLQSPQPQAPCSIVSSPWNKVEQDLGSAHG